MCSPTPCISAFTGLLDSSILVILRFSVCFICMLYWWAGLYIPTSFSSSSLGCWFFCVSLVEHLSALWRKSWRVCLYFAVIHVYQGARKSLLDVLLIVGLIADFCSSVNHYWIVDRSGPLNFWDCAEIPRYWWGLSPLPCCPMMTKTHYVFLVEAFLLS